MKKTNLLEIIRRERLNHSVRNPGIAALMSFFLMGLGQIYAGHVDRGILLLGIHLGSIVTGYSLYNKGLIYDAVVPLTGPMFLIPFCYFTLVALILLWIYNIKDAYYLSLFAGFRDMFEVERIMIPYMEKSGIKFLASGSENMIPNADSEHESRNAVKIRPTTLSEEMDETVIDVSRVKTAAASPRQTLKKKKKMRDRDRMADILKENRPFGGNMIIYGGIAVIFVLVGAWLLNSRQNYYLPTHDPSQTHLSLSADLPQSGEILAKGANGDLKSGSLSQAAPIRDEHTPNNGGLTLSPRADPLEESAKHLDGAQSESMSLKPSEIEIGMNLLRSDAIASGIEMLEKGIKSGGVSPEAWRALFKAYQDCEQIGAYEDALKRYLIAYPQDTENWINLGKLQFDRNAFVEASRSLIKALEIAPNHPRSNFLMGVIFRELGMPDEAVNYLVKCQNVDPLNPEFNKELGAAYLEINDFKLARKFFERTLSVSPNDEQVVKWMSELDDKEHRINLQSINFSPEIPSSKVDITRIPVDPENKQIDAKPPERPARGVVLYSAPALEKKPSNQPMFVLPRESIPPKISQASPTGIIESQGNVVLFERKKGDSVDNPSSVVIGDFIDNAAGIFSELKNELKDVTASSRMAETAASNQPKPSRESQPPIIKSSDESVTMKNIPGNKNTSETSHEKSESPSTETAKTANQLSGKNPEFPDGMENSEAVFKPQVLSPAKAGTSEWNKRKKAAGDASSTSGESATSSVGNKEMQDELNSLWMKGFEKYLSGRSEEALPFFLDYLRKREDSKVYDVVGLVFDKLGLPEDAYQATHRAYTMGKRDVQTLIRLGQLAERTQKYPEGIKHLKQALKKLPHRVDLRLTLSKCLSKSGDVKHAEEELRTILDDEGSSYAVKRQAEKEITALQSQSLNAQGR